MRFDYIAAIRLTTLTTHINFIDTPEKLKRLTKKNWNWRLSEKYTNSWHQLNPRSLKKLVLYSTHDTDILAYNSITIDLLSKDFYCAIDKHVHRFEYGCFYSKCDCSSFSLRKWNYFRVLDIPRALTQIYDYFEISLINATSILMLDICTSSEIETNATDKDENLYELNKILLSIMRGIRIVDMCVCVCVLLKLL